MQCCESSSEERSAGNPHATICGNRRWATASGDPVPGVQLLRSTHQLLVALWKYVTAGIVIEGAVMKTA